MVHTEGYYTGNYGVPHWLILLLPIIHVLFLPITTTQGAFTSTFAATSAQVAAEREKYKGRYMEPVGKIPVLKTKAARDENLPRMLWETSEKAVADILKRKIGQ